jgi:hypothetical protein
VTPWVTIYEKGREGEECRVQALLCATQRGFQQTWKIDCTSTITESFHEHVMPQQEWIKEEKKL